MSRHRSGGSYGHMIHKVAYDHYRMSWVVDRHYPDSRLRHPRVTRRDTDREGALRFCKRHNLEPVE